MSDPKTRAMILEELRKRRKWTKAELARRVRERLGWDFTDQSVRDYLNPDKSPDRISLEIWEAFAAVFDVNLDYVLGRTEHEDPFADARRSLGVRMAISESEEARRGLEAFSGYEHLTDLADGTRLSAEALVRRLRRRWAETGRDQGVEGTREAAAAVGRALQAPLDAIGFAPDGDALSEYTVLIVQALRAAMRGERHLPTTGDE